uniref:Uncharacterized protein n=1 Tax=Petromyzon marinus TaxID=7757 RepID=S4RTF4_PETMA
MLIIIFRIAAYIFSGKLYKFVSSSHVPLCPSVERCPHTQESIREPNHDREHRLVDDGNSVSHRGR